MAEASADSDCKKEVTSQKVRASKSLTLKRACLLWATLGADSKWWTDQAAFGRGSARGVSVVVPLMDLSPNLELEVLTGSHRDVQSWTLPEDGVQPELSPLFKRETPI